MDEENPVPSLTRDPSQDPRVQKGKEFVEMIWWSLAKRIVRIAGDHYKWDDTQWREAQENFLRPNDYKVICKL